jgi:hypothetical protein
VDQIIRKIKKTFKKRTIRVKDEFLTWLSYANAGMLNGGNPYCFDYAIRNLPSDNPIVEIGSFCGLSTNVITYYLRKYAKTNRVVTSDKWIFENSGKALTIGDPAISHAEYKAFVKETFKRNVSFFSGDNLPYTIEAFSDEFFDLWSQGKTAKDVFGRDIKLGGKISFVYIDGNHEYEYAARDFENTHKYLEKGGFILFDDSPNYSTVGSALLMKEVLKNPDYELVIRNPNHLVKRIS